MVENRIHVPRAVLTILNQLFELDRKLASQGDPANLGRNLQKMRNALAEEGIPVADGRGGMGSLRLEYEDPMGRPFRDTQTDLEATVAGAGTENLIVVDVIKPIIRTRSIDGLSQIVQQGVVVVESRTEQTPHEQDD